MTCNGHGHNWHGKAFQKAKNMLCEVSIFELYGANKDIISYCDASDYDIVQGLVLK